MIILIHIKLVKLWVYNGFIDNGVIFFDSEEKKKRITVEDTENTDEQEAETKTEEVKYEFDQSFQAKIATLFARDNKFALRTDDVIVPEYFENEAAAALVWVVKNHIRAYKSIPDFRTLPHILKGEIAAKCVRKDIIPDIINILKTVSLANADYVADQVAAFARHQATERAIM